MGTCRITYLRFVGQLLSTMAEKRPRNIAQMGDLLCAQGKRMPQDVDETTEGVEASSVQRRRSNKARRRRAQCYLAFILSLVLLAGSGCDSGGSPEATPQKTYRIGIDIPFHP